LNLRPSVARPFLLLVGGDEGAEYHRQSESLVTAWQADSCQAQMQSLPGYNHFSIIEALNDPHHEIVRMMR
jgi:arylformamidase